MPQNNCIAAVVVTFITLSVCLSQSSASRDSLAAQAFHQQKRIFCNFYGCGSKRSSSLPAMGQETRDPRFTELLAEAKRDHVISYQDDFPLSDKLSTYDDIFDDDSKIPNGNSLSDVVISDSVDPEALLKKASVLSLLRSQIIRRHAAQLKGSK